MRTWFRLFPNEREREREREGGREEEGERAAKLTHALRFDAFVDLWVDITLITHSCITQLYFMYFDTV